MEGWRYGKKPSQSTQSVRVQEYLNTASEQFQQQIHFKEQTEQLSQLLIEQLPAQPSKQQLHRLFQQYSDFWGIQLFRKGDPHVWDGFTSAHQQTDIASSPSDEMLTIRIKKSQNVTYWKFSNRFAVMEDTGQVVPYRLVTTARIEQNNVLSIGTESEYILGNEPGG